MITHGNVLATVTAARRWPGSGGRVLLTPCALPHPCLVSPSTALWPRGPVLLPGASTAAEVAREAPQWTTDAVLRFPPCTSGGGELGRRRQARLRCSAPSAAALPRYLLRFLELTGRTPGRYGMTGPMILSNPTLCRASPHRRHPHALVSARIVTAELPCAQPCLPATGTIPKDCASSSRRHGRSWFRTGTSRAANPAPLLQPPSAEPRLILRGASHLPPGDAEVWPRFPGVR